MSWLTHKRTKQAKVLKKFSQLFLDTDEWEEPYPVISTKDGRLMVISKEALRTRENIKVMGWIIDRRLDDTRTRKAGSASSDGPRDADADLGRSRDRRNDDSPDRP